MTVVSSTQGVGMRVCLIVVSLWPSVATAQPIPDDVRRDAQRLQDRENERARERDFQFRKSQIAPPAPTDAVPDTVVPKKIEPCAPIKGATITGLTLYKLGIFSADVSALTGSCTTSADIDAVLRKITNLYVRDGYITSRALSSRTGDDGEILKIIIVEGKLAKVSSPGLMKYGRTALSLTFPARANGLLNLRDIEQGVDQLARLGGADPQIDIIAGTSAGASDLIVKRQKTASWLRPSVTFTNDGSAATGQRQATFALDIDSPLGLADYWSLYYLRDLEGRPFQGAEGYGGYLSLPYGYTTLILSGGRYRYRSILQSNDLAFASTGDSINGSLGFEHLLYRDSNTKVSTSASLGLYDTTNRIQGIRLSTNSYRIVSARVGFRLQQRIGGGLIAADVTAVRGFSILGANAADIGPGSDGLRFRKVEASLAYQEQLAVIGVPFGYSAVLRGQIALDDVLPAERFGLGGSSTVRGFRDDGISGRIGFAFRQQLAVGVAQLFSDARSGTSTQLSALFGYDAGAIAPRRDDPFERGFLHSSIAGLRLLNRRLQAEVSFAVPISAPATVRRNRYEFAASLRLSI
jgi:hemolysin activation/secretion protein